MWKKKDVPEILKAEVPLMWTVIKTHKYVLWSTRLTVFLCTKFCYESLKGHKSCLFLLIWHNSLPIKLQGLFFSDPSVQTVYISNIEIWHIWRSQNLKMTNQMRYRNIVLSVCGCFLSLLFYIGGKPTTLITRDSLSQCIPFFN